MTRWKASAIHLGISAVIGALVLTLILGIWYPTPYFDASGGKGLTLLLLGVDLVLGPLLTLVVYRHGKKGMAFDLAVIGILQASALAYGLHVTASARPVFVVAAIDRFAVMAANDLDPADVAAATDPRFSTLSWTGPQLVGVKRPTDIPGRNKLSLAILDGKDIQHFPQFYADYAATAPALLEKAKPLADLRRVPGSDAVLDAWLAKSGRGTDTLVWLPMLAGDAVLTVLLDAKTGELVDTLPIDAWD